MTTSPDLGIPYVAAQQAQPEVTHNEAIAVMQALLKGVVNMTTATPPGSPTDGDAYVIAASPTGAWAGRAGAIAVYVSNAWRFIPGNTSAGSAIAMGARHEGMRVYNQADNYQWVWSGSAWLPLVGLGGALIEYASSHVASATLTGSTAETAMATATIPGGLIGANGRIEGWGLWSYSGATANWFPRVRLGGLAGTQFRTATNATTVLSTLMPFIIANRNAQNSQVGPAASGATGWGTSTSTVFTGSVDTSANQDLVFTGQLNNAADSMILQAYAVRILRKA
jgi:hypothetical protein